MIRAFLSFLVALLTCYSSFAKQPVKPSSGQSKHTAMVHSLLQQQGGRTTAMRTTSGIPTERVIGQSTRYNATDTLTDSVNLFYSPNMGSTYDYNDMLYAYNYPYSTSPMFNYEGVFSKPQVMFDTMHHFTNDPNTLTYGFYETDVAQYDVNRNTTAYAQSYADSAFQPNMLYSNTFNTANNIVSGSWYNWAGGVAAPAFKQYFAYNTSNELIEDSIYEFHLGSWALASKTYYTYDGSANLIQIDQFANDTDTSFTLPLYEQLQYINTYDGSHRLLTVASSVFTGSSLDPYIRDTFAYSGSYTYHNSWKEYQYDPINAYWAPMFNMSKIANGAGLPDTVYIQGFDSLLNAWVPQTMATVSYDAANNPDTLQDYEYNFTSFPFTPSYTTIYYYETYLLSLNNTTITKAADNTVIYPNPTTNIVTIAQLNVPRNTTISITVTNASGQMVSRQQQQWQGSAQVSLADMKPGIYWVTVQDGRGKTLHKQSVVKQ